MRKARTMSSKTKTKSTSKAQLMQLLKFKVIEWEAAQDLLDEQMQQTEAATDLQELVDELRQQKAELDRMCNELIEQQLTQEEFDTVAAESARRNCRWLRTKQKVRLLHGSNHQKFSSSDTSSEEPNRMRSKVVVSGSRRKQPSGMRRKTPMQNAGGNAESWDEVFSSDDHDGVPFKNSHRDLQKERTSIEKYNAQQQKPKENSEIQEHRSFSEDAKQVQSCPIVDVNVPNQGFATLNISRHQPSDTVYWNSGTATGFQHQAMPDNFTQTLADNHYPRDQQQSRHLLISQMDHSFPETNKMMNAPNGETNRHLYFMPLQFSEQQFQQRPRSSEWTNHQVMMNAFSLPKISLDHFSGDPLMWHQWYSFFKSTIHDNPALSTVRKMTYLQNSVTHKAKDFICGYSYNGDFYEEALQELIRKFGKPQHVVSAYLTQLEQWPRTRMDDPSSFVSFASFLRRLVQTFRLHHFESDLKASAVVKVAKEKLTTPMTIRWNQHVRSMRIEQPNLADFAEWISTYAEACEDVSPQRQQRTDRVERPSQGQKHIVLQASSNCQLCSGDHNLGRCKEYLSKSVADRQQLVRHHNLCVNCLKRHESRFCISKIRCLVDRCNGFHHSTLHRDDFRTLQRSDFQATSKG